MRISPRAPACIPSSNPLSAALRHRHHTRGHGSYPPSLLLLLFSALLPSHACKSPIMTPPCVDADLLSTVPDAGLYLLLALDLPFQRVCVRTGAGPPRHGPRAQTSHTVLILVALRTYHLPLFCFTHIPPCPARGPLHDHAVCNCTILTFTARRIILRIVAVLYLSSPRRCSIYRMAGSLLRARENMHAISAHCGGPIHNSS